MTNITERHDTMPPADTTPRSQSTFSHTAGTKRKRDSKAAHKFYAVRNGRTPGIYHSWDECRAQITGFSGPMFKAFSTHHDAENFVNNNQKSLEPSKWYAVQAGRIPGVYSTWEEARDQVTGYKNPQHKSFKTKAEAEQFVTEGRNSTSDGASNHLDATSSAPSKKAKTGKGRASKGDATPAATIDLADYEPGDAPLPANTEDGFDAAITLDQATGLARYKTSEEQSKVKAQSVRPAKDSAVKIYTDGSALGNGQNGAVGGVGVFFGPGDRRNLSESLAGTRQTNQRAELTAILRALEVAPRDRKVTIYSDSNYAINCVTLWFQKWRANNWHNAAGKPVENKDLVQKVLDALEERHKVNRHRVVDEDGSEDHQDDVVGNSGNGKGRWEKGPASVNFVWVKGHDKDQGNNAADELAVNAAREAKQTSQTVGSVRGDW